MFISFFEAHNNIDKVDKFFEVSPPRVLSTRERTKHGTSWYLSLVCVRGWLSLLTQTLKIVRPSYPPQDNKRKKDRTCGAHPVRVSRRKGNPRVGADNYAKAHRPGTHQQNLPKEMIALRVPVPCEFEQLFRNTRFCILLLHDLSPMLSCRERYHTYSVAKIPKTSTQYTGRAHHLYFLLKVDTIPTHHQTEGS